MLAHDADAHLLGSAEAAIPAGGGLIASHVTAFRGDHCAGNAASSPPPSSTATPPTLARPAGHPSQAQIGFHACGRADYYLSHDWAPGRSPRDTSWSLLVGTTRRGLVVGPDQGRRRHRHQTTRPSWKPATWSPSDTTTCTGLAAARARSQRRLHRHPATENGDTTMSAFIVHPEHINALIWAGLHHLRGGAPLHWVFGNPTDLAELTPANATSVGRMLLEENTASVNHLHREHHDINTS